jgi:hypothetical protein
MAVEDKEMSLAVCNLLQTIIDSLSGEDKREHRGKEEALVLGRRHFLGLVQGRVSHDLRLGVPVCRGGLVLFLHAFSDYKNIRGITTLFAIAKR